MAGVKRITREEISTIRDDEDAWKIVYNPPRPRKRARLSDGEASAPSYIYEQNLEDFDRRLSFSYSVQLYGQLVDWKKKGKGADKFKTYDKIEYSGLSISIGDIVYVNFGDPDAITARRQNKSDTTIKQDLDEDSDKDSTAGNDLDTPFADADDEIQEPIPDWVAKVLECRAFDEEHVFLRVLWLYRPEDLPSGRKPWHGSNEVFPSNNMQIIDAMTVTDMAKGLAKWNEKERKSVEKGSLMWRQPCKVEVKKNLMVTNVLGKLPTYCLCREPANPDRHLINCKACNNWMHDLCIEREAVKEAATKGLAENPSDKKTLPTASSVDEATAPVLEADEKPTPHVHFNPLSGAVKLFTDHLKRAASPFKDSAASKAVGEAAAVVEDIGKAIMETVAPAALTRKSFTAQIVGLDGEDTDVPMRIEIREENPGHDGAEAPMKVEKIQCLFCQHEIE